MGCERLRLRGGEGRVHGHIRPGRQAEYMVRLNVSPFSQAACFGRNLFLQIRPKAYICSNFRGAGKPNYRLLHTEDKRSKIRKFFDEYGKLGIGVYLGISALSLSSIYGAVRIGVDFDYLLEKFKLKDNKLVSKAGPFAFAYGIHKILAPLRFLLAVALTPIIRRRFVK